MMQTTLGSLLKSESVVHKYHKRINKNNQDHRTSGAAQALHMEDPRCNLTFPAKVFQIAGAGGGKKYCLRPLKICCQSE